MSNGRLNIAFDKGMRIRDFFFPLVGLENHAAGHPFRLGVMIDNNFSWVGGDDWEISMKYFPETLVSDCLAVNRKLEVALKVNDAVYSFLDLYLKKIIVENPIDAKREIKVFFAHDFHIYGEDTGDTVMYQPTVKALVHYKRKRYFLINGETNQGTGIYEFAAGQKESFGKIGTWKDAEDGVLEGNPIAQGSVDSAVSFKLEMEPKSSDNIYYWIACAENIEKTKEIDIMIRKTGVEQLLLETENYWSAWVNKQNLNQLNILPQEMIRMFKTSLIIMRSHVNNHGAIISSCDSDILQFNRDTYSFVWPRDASICALAFDIAGFQEVSRIFFKFCNRTISDEGYFRHKYWADGSVGSSWHALIDAKRHEQLPIQLDETALVMYALWRHFQKYRDLEFISQVYERLVVKPAQFLENYIDSSSGLPRASFDMWEEKAGIFTATASCIYVALSAAAKFAKVFYDSSRQNELSEIAEKIKTAILTNLYDGKLQRFIKAVHPDGYRDITVDSSLAFTFLYGAFDADSKEVVETMGAIREHLWVNSGIGGIARYENDAYHRISKDTPGNPWFICTLWLARWYIAVAKSIEDLEEAFNLLAWTVKYALPSGILAEQLNPYSAEPLSVSPLIWSHAEFVITTLEYIDKYEKLSSLKLKSS